MLCNHKWKVVDKTFLPSRLEVGISLLGKEVSCNNLISYDDEGMLVIRYILVLACSECGKIKTVFEKNWG